jgi:aspartyl-tRNA(Asn)/glutamyl-tRNA(Gln) amidotransferase subunit A
MDSIFFYRHPENTDTQGGSLRGVKIAIQPNISAAGWPTDAGSRALINFTALEDATVVERLRQAGAVLCGSTQMSEFGFGLQESKAAGALQSGAADAELVLDLMGESRMIASQAAVCGFKPSYGLISRCGLIGLIPSMECYGLISGSLENIRAILQIIAGPDERDFSLPDEKTPDFLSEKINPQKTTIGMIKEVLSDLNAEQAAIFRSAVEELKIAGFTIKEMSLPDFSLFSIVHKIVGSVEASSCAGRYDSVRYGQRAPGAKNWNEMYLSSRGAAFGSLLKSYLFQGAYFQFERYNAFEDACRIRARLLQDMQRITAQADFLVFPTVNLAAAGAPLSLADTYAQFAYTAFANVTGQPALHLPQSAGAAHSGLQLAGPRLSDGRLIALGECIRNMRRGGK